MQKQQEVLRQYCKDIPARNNANNAIIIFSEDNITDSFKFKAKITGQTEDDGTKDVEIMVPLKYLKVTSAIKHRNTAEEIIIYTHTVYSLLLKLERNKA